jgi:hypothetical protein
MGYYVLDGEYWNERREDRSGKRNTFPYKEERNKIQILLKNIERQRGRESLFRNKWLNVNE